MKSYVYILLCCDMTYYAGSTGNLSLRMQQHLNGYGAIYTQKRLPLKIVHLEEYDSYREAYRREQQIIRMSHDEKEELIRNSYLSMADIIKMLRKLRAR